MSSQTQPIPFIDLRPQHQAMGEELYARWREDVTRSDFILGQSTREFEADFGKYLGTKHAIGVNSGTDALLLALKALGIGPGDDVVLPAFTFIATADVVIRLGARPVLADIDPKTYCVTAKTIEAAMTPKTKAIMPVHLYGKAAPMGEIMALAKKRGVHVVEDVAQATGATIGGKQVGTFGAAGAYSFYPTKNLGGPGDGGAICTDSDEVAAELRMMRDHGKGADGLMQILGYNSRLPSLMGSYLILKLRTLDEQIAQRRAAGLYYNERFNGLDEVMTLPEILEGDTVNLYTLRLQSSERRDSFRQFLKEQGVATAVYYSPAVHMQPVFAPYGCKAEDFPVSYEASKTVVSLPAFPGMTQEQRERVADAVCAWAGSAVATWA